MTNATVKKIKEEEEKQPREQADEVSHKLGCSGPGRPGGSNVGTFTDDRTGAMVFFCRVVQEGLSML